MTNIPPEQSEILRIVEAYRRALEKHDADAMNRLIEAYRNIYERLIDKISLLLDEIGTMEEVTAGQVARMTRYKSLIEAVGKELTDFQVITRSEIERAGRLGIELGNNHSIGLLKTITKQAGIDVTFNRLPTNVIQKLLGFLSPDSPLFKRLEKLAGTNAKAVADAIIEGVGLGYNPRVIAGKIKGLIDDALGNALTDSLRMTRTVQIWSYREASRANYLANSDVVEGWIWYATLGEECCAACIAQHGSIHGLDEVLDDHFNGMCTPLPIVSGMSPLTIEAGEDWFNHQSAARQQEILGKSKWEAWKDGKFEFSQLATKHEDEVYGLMNAIASLADLLGEEEQ